MEDMEFILGYGGAGVGGESAGPSARLGTDVWWVARTGKGKGEMRGSFDCGCAFAQDNGGWGVGRTGNGKGEMRGSFGLRLRLRLRSR